MSIFAEACCTLRIFFYSFVSCTKPWNRFVSILAEAFCVSRFIKNKLHMLPSFGQICEHFCRNFLRFRNFFFAFLHLSLSHGVDLWTFLQKLVVLHFCPRAFLKSLLNFFYFLVLWGFTFVSKLFWNQYSWIFFYVVLHLLPSHWVDLWASL